MVIAPPHSPSLRLARLAVAATFLVNGLVLANWVVRIPAVRDKLALSEGTLGLALLGAAVGSLLAMPATGWLSPRFGSARVTRASALGFCAALPLLALAPNLPLLMLALVLFGACNGVMDVGMNAQAAEVEARYGRPIMSGFHGLWSVGGLLGAVAAGFVAGSGVPLLPHLLGAGLLLAVAAVVATARLLPAGADGAQHGPAFARPSRALIGLGVITFCAMLSEGAVIDWSAVYLRDYVGAGPREAAAGFGAFSLAMAGGRLVGDRLTAVFGPVALIRAGGMLAAAGMAAGLLVGGIVPTLLGFLCAGAGISIVVPLALSAAGATPGVAPGTGIAAVATVGYFGFLVGPTVIGFGAEATSLRASLGVVVLLTAAYALLASTARRATPHHAPVPAEVARA